MDASFEENGEQQRSVTPNFSFRSFFEKSSTSNDDGSDGDEKKNKTKKNAFARFMAFEPESVTKDEEEEKKIYDDEEDPNGCSPNLKRLETLFKEEEEAKKERGGKSRGGFPGLRLFGTESYGENPADYMFDDLGGFVPPRGANWVSTSAEVNAKGKNDDNGDEAEKSTIVAVLERNKETNASKKLPGGISILRAPSNVIMAKDDKGRTLPVLPEKMDDETLLRTTHSRDPSEIPEDVLLALEEEAKEEAEKKKEKDGGELDVAPKLGAPTPTPTPTSTPMKKSSSLSGGGSSNFRKKQDLKRVSGVTIPSSMWEIVEFNRAMIRVMTMLMKELKPLGVEGMTIFDPIAGIMLWREQRAEARLKKTSKQYLYGDEDDEMHDEALFFDNNNANTGGNNTTNINNIRRDGEVSLETMEELKPALRHASAAYGTLSALLMNASNKEKFVTFAKHVEIQNEKDPDVLHDKITETAAKHANVSPEDILVADWETLQFSPASYVAVDRNEKLVVLAIRGTANGSDFITDACSTSVPFLGGFAHSGVVMSAWQIISTRLPQMTRACYENPDFKVLLTGHSMGAAVAVCVAMLLRSGDVDVISAAQKGVEGLPNSEGAIASVMHNCTVVSFASPAVVTLDLSLKCQDYVTSVVAGKDVIPRLSYASVRRLLRRLNAASPAQPMLKSIGGKLREVANGLQNSSMSSSINETTSPEQIEERNSDSNRGANTTTEGEDAGNVKGAVTTSDNEGDETLKKRDSDQTSWQDLGDQSGLELRDHSGSDFLVQPGRVIHLRRLSSQRPVAQSKHATAFTDIPLSTRMMTDHIPMVYESAILEICERMKAERIEKMQEVANRFRRVASIELNSPSQHLPARVLSPGSDFKRSVADGVKSKTVKQKLANAAPSSREEGEEETQPSSSDATASTETPSYFLKSRKRNQTEQAEAVTVKTPMDSKGWQAVQNFFSTLLDSPGRGEGDEDEENKLDGDLHPSAVAGIEKDDSQIVDEFHAAASTEDEVDDNVGNNVTPIAPAVSRVGDVRVEKVTPMPPTYY